MVKFDSVLEAIEIGSKQSHIAVCEGNCNSCRDRVFLQVVHQKGCDGDVLSELDITDWSEDQLKLLPQCINAIRKDHPSSTPQLSPKIEIDPLSLHWDAA
jgi:hypothetical protein